MGWSSRGCFISRKFVKFCTCDVSPGCRTCVMLTWPTFAACFIKVYTGAWKSWQRLNLIEPWFCPIFLERGSNWHLFTSKEICNWNIYLTYNWLPFFIRLWNWFSRMVYYSAYCHSIVAALYLTRVGHFVTLVQFCFWYLPRQRMAHLFTELL